MALTGWRSALERWRLWAESGRGRGEGEGGHFGHAGGLGFFFGLGSGIFSISFADYIILNRGGGAAGDGKSQRATIPHAGQGIYILH